MIKFTRELNWVNVSFDSLPGILTGMETTANARSEFSLDHLYPGKGRVYLGFENDVPSILITPDETSENEIFAWLDTYSPESFPISQFVCVSSNQEWDEIQKINQYDKRVNINTPWPSIILGELLGQGGDVASDIANIPFYRVPASFSYTVARSVLLYGRGHSMVDACLKRLRGTSEDVLFAKRPLSVSMLSDIWASVPEWNSKFSTSKTSALQVLNSFSHTSQTLDGMGLIHVLEEHPDLFSDYAEKRVEAFSGLCILVFENILRLGGSESFAGACIAAAAFLAGRGTENLNLLLPFVDRLPSCFPWFGLFAGLGGPRLWDKKWARAVKAVERQLRIPPTLTEPPMADLSWREFAWMRTSYSDTDTFKRLSRLYPRTLTIEVVFGASCQLRFASENAENAPAPNESMTISLSKLDQLMMEIQKITSFVRHSLPPTSPSEHTQPSLFFESPHAKRSKTKKTK